MDKCTRQKWRVNDLIQILVLITCKEQLQPNVQSSGNRKTTDNISSNEIEKRILELIAGRKQSPI